MADNDEVEIESITSPRHTHRFDRARYEDMRADLLKVLPTGSEGMKLPDAETAVRSHFSEALFPGGA